MQFDNSKEILAEEKPLACSLGSSLLFSFSILWHRNGNSKSDNLLKHQRHKRTPFTQVSCVRIFFTYQELLISLLYRVLKRAARKFLGIVFNISTSTKDFLILFSAMKQGCNCRGAFAQGLLHGLTSPSLPPKAYPKTNDSIAKLSVCVNQQS